MDAFEKFKYEAQQNWALKWDKANPSNFVKECDASRARQEEVLYLKERQERIRQAVTKTITLMNPGPVTPGTVTNITE